MTSSYTSFKKFFTMWMRYATLAALSALIFLLGGPEALQCTLSRVLSPWITASITAVLRAFLVHAVAVFSVLAYSAGTRGSPEVVGKCQHSGKLPLWSYLVFAPLHIMNAMSVLFSVVSWRGQTCFAAEVVENLHVGGVLSSYRPDGYDAWAAVVDITMEFPERIPLECRNAYLCLLQWDATPLSAQQIDRAVQFVLASWKEGPVLIHCAYGRGRSVSVVVCVLVAARICESIPQALAFVKHARPAASTASFERSCKFWYDTYHVPRLQQGR